MTSTSSPSKTAIITGGSSGIGRAIVERLAGQGIHVVFSYQRDEAGATALSEATGARAVRMDLGRQDDIAHLFEYALAEFGGIDIVVNNAAVLHHAIRVEDVTPADYEFVIGGNLGGGFLVLQHAARHLRDHGRIISISTLDTVNAEAGGALYAASKAAMERIVATLAKELGHRGVTANSISPGAVDTARLRQARSAEVLEQAAVVTPLGRLSLPEDIADLVEFLISRQGGWITGQNIRSTGGLG